MVREQRQDIIHHVAARNPVQASVGHHVAGPGHYATHTGARGTTDDEKQVVHMTTNETAFIR